MALHEQNKSSYEKIDANLKIINQYHQDVAKVFSFVKENHFDDPKFTASLNLNEPAAYHIRVQLEKTQTAESLQPDETNCKEPVEKFHSPKCDACKTSIETFDRHLVELINTVKNFHMDFTRLDAELSMKERIPVHILSEFMYIDDELKLIGKKLEHLSTDIGVIRSDVEKAVEGEVIVPKQK